eukprot:m51a1_g6001 hypothetical protein (690) ;mRNA; r:19545-22031
MDDPAETSRRLGLLAELLAEGPVALLELADRFRARWGCELPREYLVPYLPWVQRVVRRVDGRLRVLVELRPGSDTSARPTPPALLPPEASRPRGAAARGAAPQQPAAAQQRGSEVLQALHVIEAEGGAVRLCQWAQCCRRHLGFDPHVGRLSNWLLRVPGARVRGSGADAEVVLEGAPGLRQGLGQQAAAPREAVAAVHSVLRAAGPVRLDQWRRVAVASVGYDPHPGGALERWLRSLPGVAVADIGPGRFVSLAQGAPAAAAAAAAAAVPTPSAAHAVDPDVASKLLELVREEGSMFVGSLVSSFRRRYGKAMGASVGHLVESIPQLSTVGEPPNAQVCIAGDPRNPAAITRNEEMRRAQRQQVIDLVRQCGGMLLRDLRSRFAAAYGAELLGGVKSLYSIPELQSQRAQPQDPRVAEMSLEAVVDLLGELDLARYRAAFEDNDIDGEALNDLTEADMQALGMEPLADRKRLVHALHSIRAAGFAAADSVVAEAIAEANPEQREDILSVLWGLDDVSAWLLSLGIPPESVQLFDTSCVDGVVLMHLDDADLLGIGVSSLGQRKKIMRETDRMRNSYFTALASQFNAEQSNAPPEDQRSGHVAPVPVAAAAAVNRAPPNEYLCPITMELMDDPVVAPDGFTYEREAITHWLARGKSISPMTGQPLPSGPLVPTIALRSAIKAFKEANGL